MEALALVESIPGWLLREDAEKLYALAGSAPGPILEVGTYNGKSTLLMATALREAERSGPIYTVDLQQDLDAVDAIFKRDYSDRYQVKPGKEFVPRPSRPRSGTPSSTRARSTSRTPSKNSPASVPTSSTAASATRSSNAGS